MIYINDIPSVRDPDSYKYIIDDRVEKIEVIDGYVVQDFGHIETGDVFSITCMFTEENFSRVQELWEARTKVNFKDTVGTVWENMRIVLREFTRDKDFPKYVTATFELWRI
ncbi:MAG: hypothetical protein IJQ01_06485 [Selenomonadaceae bacterium]|nr:hypothetical protein [Selenomonadaceae bacterium]